MAVDPRRLVELLRIAEHGSYTRAAAAQGISQPALSNSIAVLEKSLGIRVLDRTRNGATLTEFGRLLVTHAEALESLLARASDDVRLKKLGMEGSLTIGISPIASVELVPMAVARLKRETPNILVSIHEHPDDQLLAGLRTGELDIMVSPAGANADRPDIVSETLLYDEAAIMLRPQHPLARRRSLSVADLRGAQWVMPSAQTAMWRYIEALFAADNVPWPLDYIGTNSMSALKSLVMRTDAVSIASRTLIRPEVEAGYLASVPLREPHFPREITMRTRRSTRLPPIVERFASALRAVALEIAGGKIGNGVATSNRIDGKSSRRSRRARAVLEKHRKH